MTDHAKLFAALRTVKGSALTQGDVDMINAALAPPKADAPVATTQITERVQLEILEHEGIVLEAYKDSVGVWTWGGGVTDASGHKVARYKDTPTTVLRCLEVYEWLLRTKYLPEVLAAFKGFPLSEAQLGGALSFHWNTGAIGSADWVKKVRSGDNAGGRAAIMNWTKPKEIIARRQAERNLFFDGKWSSDGVVTVYTRVRKPSYQPDWASAQQVDILPMLRDVVTRAA